MWNLRDPVGLQINNLRTAQGLPRLWGPQTRESWMRIFALVVALFVTLTVSAAAQTHVEGYTRKDGTYVQGHWRSSPDKSPYNNYSYPGNTNPYTGKTATGNSDTYLQRYGSGRSSTKDYSSPSRTLPSLSAPSYTYPRYSRPTNIYGSRDDE